MSRNEYSFTSRKNHVMQWTVPKSQSTTQESVKDIIMGQYNRFMELKVSNEHLKYLCESQEKISKEITGAVSVLQQATEKTMIHQLNEKLEHLTTLHKKLQGEYDKILQKELDVVFTKWPGIYDKIKEGIDKDTLENVLTVFDNYQSGKVSANDAVVSGMDFMSKKYNLPKDFFNKSAVDQFTKNIHKQ
jgi:Zn-dependent metalloprotease